MGAGMMLKSTVLAAGFILLAGGAAQAGCGKAFAGRWVYEGSGYGQFTVVEFMYGERANGEPFGSFESETGTSRSAGGTVYNLISWLQWDTDLIKNMRIKSLGGGKCQVSLRKAKVKEWNLGGRYDNSSDNNTGILTVSGKRLKWCWTGPGNKVLGQCNTYRPEYRY